MSSDWRGNRFRNESEWIWLARNEFQSETFTKGIINIKASRTSPVSVQNVLEMFQYIYYWCSIKPIWLLQMSNPIFSVNIKVSITHIRKTRPEPGSVRFSEYCKIFGKSLTKMISTKGVKCVNVVRLVLTDKTEKNSSFPIRAQVAPTSFSMHEEYDGQRWMRGWCAALAITQIKRTRSGSVLGWVTAWPCASWRIEPLSGRLNSEGWFS